MPTPRTPAQILISNPHFHQSLPLTNADTENAPQKITYADLGATQGPTILFMPGMFASRYLGIAMHVIAEKLGVRVLVVDRPGMGSSTPVPIEKRIDNWVDLVPKLLSHLGIQHVALVSHSAGTIYLLNTLLRYPGILDPEKPFVGVLAPWVHPTYSRVTSMQMAQYIPTPAFTFWNRIPKLLLLTSAPVVASSGIAVDKVKGVSGLGGKETWEEENRRRVMEGYGLDVEVQAEVERLVFQGMFGEDTTGANDEALVCLGKMGGGWGGCEDYGGFMGDLVQGMRREREGGEGGQARLKVRAYFAETDSMIGERGKKYVEDSWSGYDDVVDFEARSIPGTDHNTLVQSVGVIERVLREAAGQED